MFKINPDKYHGRKKKRNYFEGWYYKVADKENKNVIAIIPGIIKGNIKEEGHSFIQIMNGGTKESYYITYPKDCFKAKSGEFNFEINTNTFTLSSMKLNHCDEDLRLIGSLNFVDVVKWPSTKMNPGSMGFFNYLPFMECYSQVCCIDGGVFGKILINDQELDFTGGKVYIEKNWGTSFPLSYIWVQANGFKDESIALTCSIGKVPLFFTSINGFITAIKYKQNIYTFSTINHSKMNIKYCANSIIFTFTKKNIQLIVETDVSDDAFINVKGPSKGKMNIDVRESISSVVKVELIDQLRKTVIFQGVSGNAGLELMGNLRDLQK